MATAERTLSAAAETVLEWIEQTKAMQAVVDRRTPSEAIKRLTYNPVSEELGLVFANSPTRYIYPDVPATVVARLIAARSKGKFYHKYIKNQYGLGG